MALAVYCLFRENPPEVLASLLPASPLFLSAEGYLGSAPSFFYTLSICLFIGALAGSRARIKLHCCLWVLLAMCLEISQHAVVAEKLATWAGRYEHTLFGALIGPYWSHGTFDPMDLLATLIAGAIATSLSVATSPRKNIAADR